MSDIDTPPQGLTVVDLAKGRHTSILAVKMDHYGNGSLELGIDCLVPVSIPGSQQPAFKAIGVALNISNSQRLELIAALTGKQERKDDKRSESPSSQSEGSPIVATEKQHAGSGGPGKSLGKRNSL